MVIIFQILEQIELLMPHESPFSYYSEWRAQGVVHMYNDESNQYEYVCDEGWDLNDAHVLCRMLGFPGALDATV